MNTNTGSAPRERGISLGDLLLALGVVATGVFFLTGSLQIAGTSGYSQVSPRFFPLVVSVGMLIVGLLLTIDALRGGRAEPAAEEEADPNAPTNWRAVSWIALGVLFDILLMAQVGFVLASAVLFWLVARGFKSRRPLRDVAIALILSVLVYVTFTRGLGLTLPAGILKGLL